MLLRVRAFAWSNLTALLFSVAVAVGLLAMVLLLEDVWGEAALRRPGGASYEFFEPLLPPLRYVNTDFRHYPLVLCAPGAAVKARWVSNGSAVNARANKKPMWREVGFPVHFHIRVKGRGG